MMRLKPLKPVILESSNGFTDVIITSSDGGILIRNSNGGIFMVNLKSGKNQSNAGAVVDELWIKEGKKENSIKIGI